MFSSLGLIVIGFALLIGGGELLLRGAVKIATLAKLTPAVIGLTIVAAGTSVPELAVSIIAAMSGKTDISVGNVVGSNIFNITLILGLTAVYRPLSVSGNTVRLEYPAMALVTMLFVVLSRDGWIGRLDALFLIFVYVVFTAYLVGLVRHQVSGSESESLDEEVKTLGAESPEQINVWSAIGLTVIGVALLGYGADLTVKGAVYIGQFFGMSERIIGLTIVGAGTSLPEIVTSIIAAKRGRNDVAIANILGSNLFNIAGILGMTAILSPLSVAEGIMRYDSWWMLGTALLIFPIMKSDMDINKREGKFLLAVYGVYLTSLIFA